jgi:Mg2+/Co2+ transporter CorC
MVMTQRRATMMMTNRTEREQKILDILEVKADEKFPTSQEEKKAYIDGAKDTLKLMGTLIHARQKEAAKRAWKTMKDRKEG